MSLLDLHNITKEFVQDSVSTKVLRGISLSLLPGETMAILGPSGAGKSTLLHIMGTLDEPSSGEVEYNKIKLFGQSAKKRAEFRNKELGFIFQFHHLLSDFSALENVMMPLLIRGISFGKAKERARVLIEKVGLAGKEDNRPNQLSGGEQQRVAIARALVGEPKLVLADEPTGNLDALNGRKIFDLLLSLNRELKTTLVVVTHNEELAGSFSRILRIIDGKIAP